MGQFLRFTKSSIVFLACTVPTWGLASVIDLPDLEVNPETGYIESVESTLVGSNYDVRLVVDQGEGGSRSVLFLTNDSADDQAPRLAIKGNGESWVVWWRDSSTDGIYFRRRDLNTGAWAPETRISLDGQSSRRPKIVHDGSSTWIAYEFDSGNHTAIAVVGIGDSPEPFPTWSALATTSLSGDVGVLVHSASANVWVTWVDSAQDMGWCEYDKTALQWGAVNHEPYAIGGVLAATDRIQATVLGP